MHELPLIPSVCLKVRKCFKTKLEWHRVETREVLNRSTDKMTGLSSEAYKGEKLYTEN